MFGANGTAGNAAYATYAFQGDNNTGMYSGTADTLKFATGGVERLRINSSGHCGIGTAAPAVGLHVQSNGAEASRSIRLAYDGTYYGEIKQLGAGGVQYNAAGGAQHRFAVNGADKLTIQGDGRGLSQFTAKAWVNFNGTGTVAIRDSHNVSSITDAASGDYRVVFANNLANTNYYATASAQTAGNGASASSRTVSQFAVIIYDGGYVDRDNVMAMAFGD
tara:strand:- start:80 stop:739 length:660 start_codon:yes stop_codon:yes gene_type:complete